MDILGTGGFLRSAEMEFVSLIVAEHLAHDVLAKLGEVGTVQFVDVRARARRPSQHTHCGARTAGRGSIASTLLRRA